MTKLERNKSIFECHKKGFTQKVIGEIFNIGQSAVSQIVAFMKKGDLSPKEEARGAKPKLTDKQKDELKGILLKSPTDYGYFTWDKWSIKALIKQEFEVDYHENYIWKIMKSINYSSQKPQMKDYRKDQKKVKTFKEETAPEIKKKSRS